MSNSWPLQKIPKCCDIVSGSTPRRENEENWGGEIPWVTPKDISNLNGKKVISVTPECITEKGYKSCSTSLLPKGSILFSSRAPIGLVAIAGTPMCTNQGFKNLVPHKNVDSNYLFYCMKWMAPKIAERGNGATFKEVSKATIEEFEIPLPPLPEQKRIAAILDRADALRQKRQEAINLLDDLLRSTFLDMFGDPISKTTGWPVKSLGDIADDVSYGTSEKSEVAPIGVPVLRMGNITNDGQIDLTNLKYMNTTQQQVEKYLLSKGDLLFNRTNSRELVGKTAVWDRAEEMTYAGYLVRARFRSGISSHYISAALNSASGKRMLFAMAKPAVNMSNISASDFKRIRLGIPPAKEQAKFEEVVKAVSKDRDPFLLFKKDADDLFNALVQRAFGGEL